MDQAADGSDIFLSASDVGDADRSGRDFESQVWPLTHFFSFCMISLICLEGKSKTPHRGNTIIFPSSKQLSCLRLRPLKGFLSWHVAFQGPQLSSWVASELQARDARTPCEVFRSGLGGPRTPSRTIDENLYWAFVENALFCTDCWL